MSKSSSSLKNKVAFSRLIFPLIFPLLFWPLVIWFVILTFIYYGASELSMTIICWVHMSCVQNGDTKKWRRTNACGAASADSCAFNVLGFCLIMIFTICHRRITITERCNVCDWIFVLSMICFTNKNKIVWFNVLILGDKMETDDI